MRAFIIAFLLFLSTVSWAEHPQEYDEFEAQEQLMQLQMNLWELFNQLRYAQDGLRDRVLLDIADMQVRINEQILRIVQLDQKYHGK